jgi:hypothetical protein
MGKLWFENTKDTWRKNEINLIEMQTMRSKKLHCASLLKKANDYLDRCENRILEITALEKTGKLTLKLYDERRNLLAGIDAVTTAIQSSRLDYIVTENAAETQAGLANTF